jgi:hypothetical protein
LSFIASDHACAAGARLSIDGIGPMPLKKIGGALVSIEFRDCVQNVPILLRAPGSQVSAFLLSPDGSQAIGWVSNVTAQSASQTYRSTVAGTCATGTSSYDLHVTMERLQ